MKPRVSKRQREFEWNLRRRCHDKRTERNAIRALRALLRERADAACEMLRQRITLPHRDANDEVRIYEAVLYGRDET